MIQSVGDTNNGWSLSSFLEQKEGDVDADFLHRLRSFHRGLSDDISDLFFWAVQNGFGSVLDLA